MSENSTNRTLHVVLIETSESLNIGSVARAMSNFGVSNLHLVAPRSYDRARAAITACWGDAVLDSLKTWGTLDEAIAGMHDVVGFSSRSGKNLPPVTALQDFSAAFSSAAGGEIALLFGPEDTGLLHEHLERCRAIVRIPSSAENPSLNLAQAVVIALYELTNHQDFPVLADDTPRATAAQYRAFDNLLDDVMKRSEFIDIGTPADLPGLVHSMFRRTQASGREMQILLGMMNKISKRLR